LTVNSKGVVEHLCGYVQRDLLVPALLEPTWADLAAGNAAARAWYADVNDQVHSEICAVPTERLWSERQVLRPLPSGRPPLRTAETRTVDKRGSIRFGSARYLVPKTLVGECVEVVAHEAQVVIRHAGTEVVRHDPVGPGEVAFGPWAIPSDGPHAVFVRAPRPSSSLWAWARPPRRSSARLLRPARCGWSTSSAPSSSWCQSGVGRR
jgi:hypothetical protein